MRNVNLLGIVDALRILYKSGANPFHVDKDSLTGNYAFLIKLRFMNNF